MDVTRVSVPEAAHGAPDARGAPQPPAAPGAAPDAGLGARTAVLAGIADRVNIEPLDLVAALRILISEVRVEFGLPPASGQDTVAVPSPAQAQAPAAAPTSPIQAAQQLLHLLLRTVPADDPPEDPAPLRAWAAATLRAQETLGPAVDRAVDAVSAWREVPVAVVEAAKETRALVIALLNDEPPSPLWFRPEWLEFAPRMQRHWRRRRRARQALADPDLRRSGPQDFEEPSP